MNHSLRILAVLFLATPGIWGCKTPPPPPSAAETPAPAIPQPENFVGFVRGFRVEGSATLRDVAITPDGHLALVAGWDAGHLQLWDLTSGRVVQVLRAEDNYINRVALSPNGELAVTGSGQGVIRVFEVKTGKLRGVLEGHTGEITALAFSADGRKLASAGKDRRVQVWEVSTGQHLWHTGLEQEAASCLAFSPDASWLVGCARSQIWVWETRSGRALKTFDEPSGSLLVDVVASPDGRTFVTAGYDGTVRQWDWTSGSELRRIAAGKAGIESVDISRDGQLVVTGGMDKTVRVWRLDAGREITRWEGHELWLRRVVFADRDRQVISASRDNTVRVWGMPERR